MRIKGPVVLILGSLLAAQALAEAEPRPGKAIYEVSCKVCHEQGVAGAPPPGGQMWVARLANKGMEGLVSSVKNGLNVMPAMGMCGDCTDQELINAIQFMLPDNEPM